ncbi:MAG TPA: hypothetical protein VFF60_00800 [Candidatus Binatus sp.]|nr:hypothetical protein [Candidatus Binatus sp.]
MRARAALALVSSFAFVFVALAPSVAVAVGPPSDQHAGPPTAASASLPAPIRVSANRVAYYGDQALIVARGDVRVIEPDGSIIQGDVFVMNMALRRLLVAGHVRLQTHAGEFVGAAFADFLVFRRQYFVPLEPEADRWTFFDYDFAQPKKGREMPGDAFFIPDVSASKPYIVGKAVTINASTYLRMTPATFVLLDGALWTMPLPPYTYNFSSNQHFGVNALPGASFDVPYNVAGSPVSLDAIHFRYDQTLPVSTYWALEHHTVIGQGYIVASLSPASEPPKQWNLMGYDRMSPVSAVRLNTQLFTYQYGLSQPLSASGYVDLQYNQGIRQSALLVDLTQSYSSLLAQPALGFYGNPSHPWIPNHPFDGGVQWQGYDQRIAHTGLTYRLVTGYGSSQDGYGIGASGQQQVSTYYGAASLFTPTIPGPLKTGINAAYTITQTYLSFPNIVQQQTTTATISRRLTRTIVLIGSDVVTSATSRNDFSIVSPNQALGVVPLPNSINGLPIVLGPFLRATDRAYGLSSVWTPSPEFQFSLAATQSNYSPQQIPGFAGPPRYQLSGDVRMRLTRVLFLDAQRAYLFNWGGQTWSPHFQILITSQ